jgi:hypothetical protein
VSLTQSVIEQTARFITVEEMIQFMNSGYETLSAQTAKSFLEARRPANNPTTMKTNLRWMMVVVVAVAI